jgi:Crinkler effector protein N-terminal domain
MDDIHDKISLCCSILGPDVGEAFVVDISRARLVGHLSEAILAKNKVDLAHVDARKLQIWKVSDPARYDPP